ncbi:sugar dehydrogenase complex small subunit [Herbaspirillum lusitanum]|uniref:Sugar dehydrogenase complex small subunit n=1 Tax=Herbaspirillum lusitanum TaxID=213312 RepID=A0ABW9ACZ8_9BURK
MKRSHPTDPGSSTDSPGSSPSGNTVRLTGGISRRHVLIGLAALIAEAGFWSNPLFSNAQTPPATGLAGAGAAPTATPEAAAFLKFSTRITGHADLKPETAGRIEAAMRKNYPDFAAQAPRLATLLQDHQEPKALLAAATDAGLRELALAIVAAWYTGTVGSGKNAVVVSYAEALMYQPVADGQTVPTYCNYGPLWWTKAPPAIRVSAPVAPAPAPAPATTGTPAVVPPTQSKSL